MYNIYKFHDLWEMRKKITGKYIFFLNNGVPGKKIKYLLMPVQCMILCDCNTTCGAKV